MKMFLGSRRTITSHAHEVYIVCRVVMHLLQEHKLVISSEVALILQGYSGHSININNSQSVLMV